MNDMSLYQENRELEKLINLNHDACKFYEIAKDKATNPQVVQTFRNMEGLHNGIIVDIQQRARSNGGDIIIPEKTILGAAHIFWAKLIATIGNDVDEVLVAQLEEAEEHCLFSMEYIIEKGTISPSTQTMLHNEMIGLRKGYSYMKALKECMMPA